MSPMNHLLVLSMAGAIGLGTASIARACSICLCGDPVAAAVGLQAPVRGTWTFTLENRSSSKSNALDPAGTEFEHENRVKMSASYHLSDRAIVGATLPYLARRIVEHPDGERTNTAHLGDLDLHGRIDLTSSRTAHSFRTVKLLLAAGVPIGANNMRDADGRRLDQHSQTGTGAWMGSVGIGALTRGMHDWAYVSGIVRENTRNAQGYKYGGSFLATAEIGRKISPVVALVLGAAGRTTAHDDDTEEGQLADSGGRIVYATPAMQFTLGSRASVRTEAQLPVWQDLHGTQDEDPNLIVRLTISP